MYTVGLRQSGKVSGGLCGWEGEAGGCSHIASLSAHRTASRELFPANRCHHAASGVLLKVRHGGGREVVREVDGPSQLSRAPSEDEDEDEDEAAAADSRDAAHQGYNLVLSR